MSNLISYTFPAVEAQVRIIIKDDQPWFVAKDVCNILGIKQATRAVEGFDEDEKGVINVHTPGGEQKMLAVNESGLYALIFKSRKPEAKKFRKWVTSEVLPAIRKHGAYIDRPEPLTPSEKQLLKELVHKRAATAGGDPGKTIAEIWSRIHNKFRVNSYHELPRHRLAEVIEYINTLDLRPREAEPVITDAQYGQLRWKISTIFYDQLFSESDRQQIYNYIRVIYGLNSVRELPASRFDQLMAWFDQIEPWVERFARGIREEIDHFVRDYICAGAPWTPSLRKDYRQLTGEKLPDRPDWVEVARQIREGLPVVA